MGQEEKKQNKKFIKICCPSCDTEIPSDNLNIQDKIGKCGSCNAVFPFDESIKKLTDKVHKGTQKILRPEGIEMFYFDDELEMSFDQPANWLDWVMLTFVSFFTLAGWGIWVESGGNFLQLLLALSPVWIGLAYHFRRKRHKKYIKVDKENITIRLRPHKLIKDKIFAIHEVKQLYVKHYPSSHRYVLFMQIDKGNGQEHIKITTTKSASKAKFIEQEIESFLNIEDVIVPEETK